MGFKLFVGRAIDKLIYQSIKFNYHLVPFIKNGKILELDLKRAKIEPKYIFDIGANVGQSAYQYNNYFPEANIFCFEPVRSVYQNLVDNTKSTKQIRCFNLGLGDTKEKATIYKNEFYDQVASLKGANNQHLTQAETIEITTGENICAENNIPFIDILKIDTEGYEIPVLKGFGTFLKDKISFVIVEAGYQRNDPFKTHLAEVLDYLQNEGFVLSGFYNNYLVGKHKLQLHYSDVLFTNTALVDI